MAYTQADLDRLDRAIASGVLTVEVAGRRMTYHSVDELLKARSHVAAQLAGTSANARTGATKRFTFASLRGD
jgi:arginase family enzyme